MLLTAIVALATPALGVPPLQWQAGALRERASGQPVSLFGAGYNPAFGLAHESLQAVCDDLRPWIDADLADLRRLGLNAVRIVVDDAEIMAADGSLVENSRLATLDYLLAAAGRDGLYLILTASSLTAGREPIRDDDGRPVSLRARHGGPQEVAASAAARELQARFLTNLLGRVNPLTHQRYADATALALIEPVWQPTVDARVPAAELTAYVRQLVDAIRAAGATQPVVWQLAGRGDDRLAEVLAGGVDGVGVAVHPGGVDHGRAVDLFPFAVLNAGWRFDREALAGKLLCALEYDAADTLHGALLPALAQSLRAAGAQAVCLTDYDPLALAEYNNCWPSHFTNLVTTPSRAVALRVAAEVFANGSRQSRLPLYPSALQQGPLRLEVAPDTARWLGEELLLHSNSIGELPPRPAAVREVVGVGASRLVGYDGLGSYWLRRLDEATWLLRLYPDAMVVGNPFDLSRWTHPRRLRPVVHLALTPRPMTLELPGLGETFWLRELTTGAGRLTVGQPQQSRLGQVLVRPGVYLVQATPEPLAPPDGIDPVVMLPPAQPPAGPLVAARFPQVAAPGQPLPLQFQAVGDGALSVALRVRRAGETEFRALPAEPQLARARATRDVHARMRHRVTWLAVIPPEVLRLGDVEAYWDASDATGPRLVPAAGPAGPARLRVGRDLPLVIHDFDGSLRDRVAISEATADEIRAEPWTGSELLRTALRITWRPRLAAGRWLLRLPVDLAGDDCRAHDSLRLLARAETDGTRLRLGLVEDDGATWAVTVTLPASWREHTIPLHRLGYLSGGVQREAPTAERTRELWLEGGGWSRGSGGPGQIDLDELAFVVAGR